MLFYLGLSKILSRIGGIPLDISAGFHPPTLRSIVGLSVVLGLSCVSPAQAQLSGPLSLTDVTPPPFPPAHVPFASGGASLWTGEELTFPEEHDASLGDGQQIYRGVAASLTTPGVTCTAGSATITATVRLNNDGPNPGQVYSGSLRFYDSAFTTPLAQHALTSTPVNAPQVLTVTTQVPAADLSNGTLRVGVWVETLQRFPSGSQPASPKSWTASQFEATYTYDDPSCAPGLTLEKTGTLNDLNGNNLINLGETITYSFTVQNTGGMDLTNVTIDDPLLSAAGVSIEQGPQTLAAGASFTFTAIYTPTQADINAEAVTNSATATGTSPSGPVTSPPDSVTIQAEALPGLSLQKTGALNDLNGNNLIDDGETITYSFLVQNTGAVTLMDVTIVDPLLSGVLFSPQTLAPGATYTFTADYTPTQAEIDAGSVTNTATATGSSSSGQIDSPPSSSTIQLATTPALTITKDGTLNDLNGNGFVNLGETIEYRFVVTNTGRASLSDVTVIDPLLANAGVPITPGPQTLNGGESVTFTAIYTPTQTDIDAGLIVNSATATATPPPGFPPDIPVSSPPSTITFEAEPASLLLEKNGTFNDEDGDGYASVGDTISYIFDVTNDGPQTVTNIWPVDPGPTFNGVAAGGTLTAFQPGPAILAPGESQAFTATYTLTKVDVDNAAGLLDGVSNSATARGQAAAKEVISNVSTSALTIPIAEASDINVSKIADIASTRRGEQAPFTIQATKNGAGLTAGFTIVDTIPPGFRFVEGSASVNGVEVTPEVAGREIRFSNVEMSGASAEIKLRLLALSTAAPGEHVNLAHAEGASGDKISNDGSATITIMVEPVFDCGDVLGRVFNDNNRNGYQDDGEAGLPGARITSVGGMLITTDEHGRFSVACADLPDGRVGSSYVMKLDPRSLPTGYRILSENPRVVRLTAGKMSEINFATSIGRIVRLDLNSNAFLAGSADLSPVWQQSVASLVATLESEPSVLRIVYREPNGDRGLANQRMKQLRRMVSETWKEGRNRYRLEIETRVETGQPAVAGVE
jgi:uncharacterized repeat protein (TIGR01451 family)